MQIIGKLKHQKEDSDSRAGFFGLALAIESQFLSELPVTNSLIIRLSPNLIIESIEKFLKIFLFYFYLIIDLQNLFLKNAKLFKF